MRTLIIAGALAASGLANAHLMAAAPLMAKALEYWAEAEQEENPVTRSSKLDIARHKRDTAIAKAYGES